MGFMSSVDCTWSTFLLPDRLSLSESEAVLAQHGLEVQKAAVSVSCHRCNDLGFLHRFQMPPLRCVVAAFLSFDVLRAFAYVEQE